MKILLTAIGKRVQLIQGLKKYCSVIGTDAGDLAPAEAFVDKFYKIPKCNEEGYIETLFHICKNEKVKFLIPLYELEFNILCENREAFQQIGTTVLLSDRAIIDICQNKLMTYKFFTQNEIKTAKSYTKEEISELIMQNESIDFPLIVKPADGMGSSNVFKVNNLKELEFFIDYVNNPIIQEFLDGVEYTIDVLCDLNGNVISIVPRVRLEVRSGEVSKSKTVINNDIINETKKLMNCLKKYGDSITTIGPYTVQCKITSKNEIKFIEINPRFGGGVPLSFKAGVDYGKFFCMMGEGIKIAPIIGEFKEIIMIRYDDAIFIE